MDALEMSSKGNTAWMVNTIRPGSYLYLLQDLSLETQLLISKIGCCPNCQILQTGNSNNDLKYMRKWKLPKKIKLASIIH